MKKILLASTILAMSAGYAAAEVSFSGSASMGVARDGSGNFRDYSDLTLDITMSGEADNGLSFGATMSGTFGASYTFGDDDGFDYNDHHWGQPEVWVSGAFGKIAMSHNNYDFHDDDNDGGDLKYTGTFGAISLGLIVEIPSGEGSVSFGYSAGSLALNANIDTFDEWNIDATYTVGSIAITGATNEDSLSSIKVAYDADGVTASVKLDTDDEWTIELGYSANSISINASTNSDDGWSIDGSYDLGGGLSAVAGANYDDDVFVGMEMAF